MQYSSPRRRDASILRSSQENDFQSPQCSQSFKENFATSAAFQDLVTNKRKHSDNVLLSYLSINSLRHKMKNLKVLVSKSLPDYLVISETEAKINEEFPNSQFLIENYDIRNRRDRNKIKLNS